jgi:chemotaxis protein MotB
MSPKYFQSPAHNRDRWLVSYVDVLTILLLLFLFMAAGSINRPISTASATAPAPEGKTTPAHQALLDAQKRLQQEGLDVHMETRGLVIGVSEAILFPSGEDQVNPQAYPIIAHLASVLREMPNPLRLEGHADSVPIHNQRFRNNWDLSMSRSLRMMELLSQQYGIADSRLSIASYGPYHPHAPNETTDGRASNRRVDILIVE